MMEGKKRVRGVTAGKRPSSGFPGPFTSLMNGCEETEWELWGRSWTVTRRGCVSLQPAVDGEPALHAISPPAVGKAARMIGDGRLAGRRRRAMLGLSHGSGSARHYDGINNGVALREGEEKGRRNRHGETKKMSRRISIQQPASGVDKTETHAPHARVRIATWLAVLASRSPRATVASALWDHQRKASDLLCVWCTSRMIMMIWIGCCQPSFPSPDLEAQTLFTTTIRGAN